MVNCCHGRAFSSCNLGNLRRIAVDSDLPVILISLRLRQSNKMATTDKKVVVVFGGTGRIGKRVALSLQDNARFHVKVATRDASTSKAKGLADAGIDVVQADILSETDLNRILTGAWGVFLNTNSEAPEYDPSTGLTESQVGLAVVEGAARQRVHVFIHAGLPDSASLTDNTVQITSFNEKTKVSKRAFEAGFTSAVNVNVGWKMENFWDPVYEKPFGGFARVRDSDGYLTLKLFTFGKRPEPTPFTSVKDDYGDIVHGVFLNPEKWNRQTVWAISDPMTFQQVAEVYNAVTGTTDARYVVQADRVKASTPEKEKEVNGIRDYVEHVNGLYCAGKPIDLGPAKELKKVGASARGHYGTDTELQTFEQFIRDYGIASRNDDMQN